MPSLNYGKVIGLSCTLYKSMHFVEKSFSPLYNPPSLPIKMNKKPLSKIALNASAIFNRVSHRWLFFFGGGDYIINERVKLPSFCLVFVPSPPTWLVVPVRMTSLRLAVCSMPVNSARRGGPRSPITTKNAMAVPTRKPIIPS